MDVEDRKKDFASHRSDLSDFIWLIYSVFFFIEPVMRHNTQYWIQFAIFFAIFLALYSGLIFAPKRWQHYLLLFAMWVLGAVYYPQNEGAWGVFVYVAAMIPFIAEPLVISAVTFAVACGTLIVESFLLHRGPWSWAFGSLMIFSVGGINLLMAQKVRANKKLHLANEEIEQLAKLAERERIARDLHDVLGHTLSVIVLKSELAGRLLERDPQRAAAEIADVENISRTALSEVREAIRGYRAEGLAAEIKRARSTLDAAGVTLICEEKVPVLNPTEETVVSLVVREAVTNVVRHAQASRCVMRFTAEDGRRVLLVEDDGRGGVREEGNGLRGMRERVESLGGRFAIDGSSGTRLLIELPAAGVPL